MRGTIMRIGVIGVGAFLALGLFTASPAGATTPVRQDKSERRATADCFIAEGKTQGRSHSDPDAMSNGGADKPGCLGGLGTDRDGNNGCGNDADREDDNNGRCAQEERRKSSTTTSTTTTSTTVPVRVAAAGTDPDAAVLTSSASLQAAEEDSTTTAATTTPATVEAETTSTTEPQTEVLGQTLERPNVLARTGAGVGGLTLLGGLLCGGGRLAVLARRFLRID